MIVVNISPIFKNNPTGKDGVYWAIVLGEIVGEKNIINDVNFTRTLSKRIKDERTVHLTIAVINGESSEKHYILIEQSEEWGKFLSADFKEVSHKEYIDFKNNFFFLLPEKDESF